MYICIYMYTYIPFIYVYVHMSPLPPSLLGPLGRGPRACAPRPGERARKGAAGCYCTVGITSQESLQRDIADSHFNVEADTTSANVKDRDPPRPGECGSAPALYTYKHIYIYIRIYIYIYVHMYIYIYIDDIDSERDMYVCVYIYIYVHIHIGR